MTDAQEDTLPDQILDLYSRYRPASSKPHRQSLPSLDIENKTPFFRLFQAYISDPNKDDETDLSKISRIIDIACAVGVDILLETDPSPPVPRKGGLYSLRVNKREGEWVVYHARAALTFIRTVLWRYPKVLLHVETSQAPPLLEYMAFAPKFVTIPILMTCLTNSVFYSHIQDCVADLFFACYDFLIRSPEGWSRASGALRFINGTAADAVLALSVALESVPASDMSFSIPSSDTISLLSPRANPDQPKYPLVPTRTRSVLALSRVFYLCVSLLTHAHLPTVAALAPPLDLGLQIAEKVRSWSTLIASFTASYVSPDGSLGGTFPANSLFSLEGGSMYSLVDDGFGACRCVGELLGRSYQDSHVLQQQLKIGLGPGHSLASRHIASLSTFLEILTLESGPLSLGTSQRLASSHTTVVALHAQFIEFLFDILILTTKNEIVRCAVQEHMILTLKDLISRSQPLAETASSQNGANRSGIGDEASNQSNKGDIEVILLLDFKSLIVSQFLLD